MRVVAAGRVLESMGFAALLLAMSACAKYDGGCEKVGLAPAADLLEAHPNSEGVEGDALLLIHRACRRVDPAIMYGLGVAHGLEVGVPGSGPEWSAERLKVCADPDGWSALVAGPGLGESLERLYAVCDFGRFGLLEPGELKLRADLSAFFARNW